METLYSSRRNFLQYFSAIAAAPLARAASQAPPAPDVHFPTEPRARLAVTSYPFRAYIQSPTNKAFNPEAKSGDVKSIDLKDFARMVVDRFGVHNINPLASHFGSTNKRYLDEFQQAVAKAGSHLVGLGLGGGKFYDPDASVRSAAVDSSRKWIDIASVLGSPSVRQHVSGVHGLKPDVALASESLGALSEYGSKRGVIVNLENDNPVAEDPFFLVDVIERVKSPWLRALPDFGNSLLAHDHEYNRRALTKMFQHAYSMSHVKDSVLAEDGKVSTVDLAAIFGIAKAAGYRGYFSMECETGLSGPFAGTEKLVQESLKYLK